MALPMDEQRILEEMERMLAADDPRLAAQLASLGRPGLGPAMRTRRARSLLTLAIIATVAILLYAMIAFRLGGVSHGPRTVPHASRSASVVPGPPAASPPQLMRAPGGRIWP